MRATPRLSDLADAGTEMSVEVERDLAGARTLRLAKSSVENGRKADALLGLRETKDRFGFSRDGIQASSFQIAPPCGAPLSPRETPATFRERFAL